MIESTIDTLRTEKVRQLAYQIRAESLKMVNHANASHIGGALSMADILAVLYGSILRKDPSNPENDDRDRFILSKGHACVGLYAALALCHYFPIEELETYGQDMSSLMAHVSHKVPGVEFSTGSLGHGLPFGTGTALAAKRQGKSWRTFVLLSDGELDEGSNWEAFLFAAHHRLDNLIAIIDYNKIQSLGNTNEVLCLEPLAKKLEAFSWAVQEIDGHDVEQMQETLEAIPLQKDHPSCIIAHTVKGKGISFMENQLAWHYKSPDHEQLQQALSELKENF